MSWKCKTCGQPNMEALTECARCQHGRDGTKQTEKRDMQKTKNKAGAVKWPLVAFLVLYAFVNREALFFTQTEWQYTTKTFESEQYLSEFSSEKKVFLDRELGEGAKVSTSITIPPAALNKLGEDGWELVDTYLEMETAFYNYGKRDYHTGIKSNVRPQRVVAIFKRPK